MSTLKSYLEDPFLLKLWQDIRKVDAIKSISLDITHRCNLRCTGCYYFEEGMDRYESPEEERLFDGFIQKEKDRGTNFVTIVGGEPSLVIDRMRKIYANFKCSVATNGVKRIPKDGLEELPIGVSLWGSQATDSKLRVQGKTDLFSKALKNYHHDERAFWYYTAAPGYADEIPDVVAKCVDNGNAVLFNYYSDVAGLGGKLDYRLGFDEVRKNIDLMIERYPDQILMTQYFNEVVSTGEMADQKWGYDVCTNVSIDNPVNAERLQNGNAYNKHFNAYCADFETTRRCCTGMTRDCASCYDTWEHFSWIMLHSRKHMHSKEAFTNWLTTVYTFYLINRLVDPLEGRKVLRQMHERRASEVTSEV